MLVTSDGARENDLHTDMADGGGQVSISDFLPEERCPL